MIDVAEDRVIADGLTMPHSPRWHDEKLWLLEAGTGWFGHIDVESGQFEQVTFCPGYARGLAFAGNYAFVGVSKPRREKSFHDLPLQKNLAERGTSARCGVYVIDLKSGDVVDWLQLAGGIEELYDVVVLPGVECPKALGFKTNEIRRSVWLEQDGRQLSWSAQSNG